ncbi:MAG: hypothetical protein HFH68_00160 [Lachnospiraceae bacterium]|nr:hypothetical protein [Lachnospiraceae bacterium]
MGKELCFCIENNNLYLEQVLVDYNDIPIFFLCKDNFQYYVALCTDIYEFNYIVTNVSSLDVYNLLHGKIPMRNTFTDKKEYWKVISGEEISLDIVTKHSIDYLDISLLPEKYACFKILTKEIETFVQNFDNEFFNTKHFNDTKKDIMVNEMLTNYLKIESFIDICNCSFKYQLKQPSKLICGLDKKYLPQDEKTVILQKHELLEEWRSGDTINVAA